MAETWPVSLPQRPLVGAYSEKLGNITVRSPNDAGPPNTRRRFTASIDKFSIQFIMTLAQVATFRTFFYDTIHGGAVTVTMPHPRTGVSGTFRILGTPEPTISGISNNLARVEFQMESVP